MSLFLIIVAIWLALGVVAWVLVMDFTSNWRSGRLSDYLMVFPFALGGGMIFYYTCDEIAKLKTRKRKKP